MAFDKFRIRFRKGGDLRLLSHHDLMRTVERMLRRAAIPFRSTSGFHPKPRFVFPLSLPLGIIGWNEAVELEVTEELHAGEVLARLAAQAPAGLDLHAIRRIPLNLTGQVVRASYRFPIPPARCAEISERCTALLAQSECWVERTHPQPKKVDIRAYILYLETTIDSLSIDFRVTPTGTARADELIGLLGLGDELDAGAIIERTNLELHDELAAGQALDAAIPVEVGVAIELGHTPPEC